MKVIRKRLSEVEATGTTTTRWNVDCVCFQTFDPFTQTWYENPTADPRTNTIYLLPPRTVGDIRCDSAANMRAKLESMLDEFYVTVEVAQLINAILAVVLVFQPGGGLLIALIIAFIEAIIEIGVAAILFDFTPPEVWDKIQCALYEEMESDGTITAEGLALAQEKIDLIDMGSTIGPVIAAMFLLLGVVGMNNAGSTGDETGDCSDCEWCYTWDPLSSPWALNFGAQGTRYVGFGADFEETISLTWIEFEWEWNTEGSGGTAGAAIFSGSNYETQIAFTNNISALAASWAGNAPFDGVTITVNANSGSGGIVTITKVVLRGTGVNPFGADNC